ncbi:hypothetical protein HY493_04885 [Candidatus Woesearchaeota archaeon]|nr:hypothetical protein [Candidatus Woesearchaeota archaeon]
MKNVLTRTPKEYQAHAKLCVQNIGEESAGPRGLLVEQGGSEDATIERQANGRISISRPSKVVPIYGENTKLKELICKKEQPRD